MFYDKVLRPKQLKERRIDVGSQILAKQSIMVGSHDRNILRQLGTLNLHSEIQSNMGSLSRVNVLSLIRHSS